MQTLVIEYRQINHLMQHPVDGHNMADPLYRALDDRQQYVIGRMVAAIVEKPELLTYILDNSTAYAEDSK